MNISHLKALTWLGALGLGGYLSYYVYDFLQRRDQLEQPVSQETQRSVLTSIPAVEPPREDVVAYGKVRATWHEMDWTGKPPPPPPPPKDADEERSKPPVKPVSELLTVLLVHVDGGDAAKSMAQVKFKDPALVASATSLDDSLLAEGDELGTPYESVVVSSIRPDGVLFSFSDDEEREEEMVPTSEFQASSQIVQVDSDGVLTPVRPEIPTAYNDRPFQIPNETLLIGKNHFLVGVDDRQEMANNYTKILAEIRYEKHRNPKTGKVDGIEIKEVPKGSFAAKYGAKAGQVIKSINGHPVTSVNEGISYAKQNQDKYDTWTIVYEEQGKEYTKVIDTSE
ncbi:MAG: hypothetical protein AAF682_13710 [Planctomycetota bacterium]